MRAQLEPVERYYGAVLLVLMDCQPRTHDIEDMGRQAAGQHPDFLVALPQKADEEK